MAQIINYFGMGGTILILLAVFIEITPIKINPIQWLGNHWNMGIKSDVDKINSKLDEHIAQSYRNKILDFQKEILRGERHSQEEFDEVIEACEAYEKYIKDNELSNGKCEHAIKYINHTYDKCLDKKDFVDLDKAMATQDIIREIK